MHALPELQTRFAAALLREDAARVAAAVVPDGLAPAARVQIYWNHVFTTLTEALESTFPVVCRLVDPRFFGFAADRYIRRHPPAGPCLFEYGATFPGFLATFPACAGHPYLADVARLEWALNRARHAEDRRPLDPAALGAVPSGDAARLVFAVDPSASWLRSPWPIDRIWQVNQGEADPEPVDLAAGGAALEVRRQGDAPTARRLAPAEFAFRAALGAGVRLEAAADAALAVDAAFDLADGLRTVLRDGLLVGLTLAEEGEAGC